MTAHMAAFLAALLAWHGYTVIHAVSRPGLLAVTDTGKQTVTLYDSGEPKALQDKIFAYEVGHVIDVSCLSPFERRYWKHLRHLKGQWYAPNYAPEQHYGAGDFADVWSEWATGSAAYFQGKRPSAHDLRVLAQRFHFNRGVCRGVVHLH